VEKKRPVEGRKNGDDSTVGKKNMVIRKRVGGREKNYLKKPKEKNMHRQTS